MDENVYCIEPNLSIFLENYELKHYNLVWGGDQRSWDPSVSFITNMLLQRTSDGQLIPPAYMTETELQHTVDSLDYDGNYFWSVQTIRNASAPIPGCVLRKWQINTKSYGLQQVSFKTFSTKPRVSCLTVEWHPFKIRNGTDPTLNYIHVDTTYDDIIDRIKVGHRIKVGPNNLHEVFWGTVSRIYGFPDDPYVEPDYWIIEFKENLNSSYVTGEDAFVEVAIYMFDQGGTLSILNPETLAIEETSTKDEYKTVTACAFSVVQNVPNINVGMKTHALFYVRDMMVYCKEISNLDFILSAQSLPLNFYANGNSFFPVYELRIRNDDYTDPNNHPQHYLLQKDYREDRADVSSAHSSWTTYNYLLQKLEAEPAHIILDVQPQFITQSGVAYCSCQVLDTYNFPLSGASVGWGHNCGSKARFLDSTITTTNVSGYSYNRLYVDQLLDFPAYVTVTGVDITT
jgi:hypothetical protein